MEICFLEDILSITNIICLVLQKDKKGFGAISRSVDVSISMLEEITQDCKSKLLKSFNTCGEIIEQLEEDFKMQSTVGQFYLKSVQHPFCNIFQYTGTISLQCAPMSNTICVTFHRFKKLQWKGQKPEFFFLFFFYLANIPLYIALYVDKTLWINVLNKVDLKLILLLALLILHNFIRNDGHTNFCEMWLQNLSFQKHIF